MSSADLSLDISRLVSRALSGENVDSGAAGTALAAKYPELGMSGDLIGRAIDRAAGMARVALRPAVEPSRAADGDAAMQGERPSAALAPSDPEAGPRLLPDDRFVSPSAPADTCGDEVDLVGTLEAALAAAVESGFADRFDDPSSPLGGYAEGRDAAIPTRREAMRQGKAPHAAVALLSRGPVAAMRRAFFGS